MRVEPMDLGGTPFYNYLGKQYPAAVPNHVWMQTNTTNPYPSNNSDVVIFFGFALIVIVAGLTFDHYAKGRKRGKRK